MGNHRVLLCLDLIHHLSRKWNCLRKLSKQNQPLDLLLHHPNLRLASGFVIASPQLMSGQPLDMSLLSLILRYGQPVSLQICYCIIPSSGIDVKEVIKEHSNSKNHSATATRVLQCAYMPSCSFSERFFGYSPPHLTSHPLLTPNHVNNINFTFTIGALYCCQ
jgi:hypothetical protein